VRSGKFGSRAAGASSCAGIEIQAHSMDAKSMGVFHRMSMKTL
jgi:hypothetical protein